MNAQEEIKYLKKEIESRDNEIVALNDFINELVVRLDKSFFQIEELERKIKEQGAIIDTFRGNRKVPKNSSNSDIPPSKDITRKNRRRSLRERSGKKPGGQQGHEGHNLEFTDTPDKVVNYIPNTCFDCGKSLDSKQAELFQSRQVHDIPPPPKPIITQHDVYDIRCSCGCLTRAVFPEFIKARVQYGLNVCSLINYLNVRHFIPYDRTVELFKDCFNIKFSKGTIANILKRTGRKAIPTYENIKEQVKRAEAIGSDETIIFVNAKRKAVWTWQSEFYTYLKATESRKGEHIKEEFPDGFPNSVLISDQYAAQLNTPAKAHQSCLAHIDRKLKYLEELEDSTWVKKMRGLLYKAIRLKKEKKVFKRKSERVREIEFELNNLLLKKFDDKTHPGIGILQGTLRKYRDTLLTFLFHEKVEPDNNSSERTFRCLKVKLKVSGSFKKLQQEFAIMRSIIDTAIKNKLNILDTLAAVERGELIQFK